jgi:hypothetical protein
MDSLETKKPGRKTGLFDLMIANSNRRGKSSRAAPPRVARRLNNGTARMTVSI